MKPLPPRLSARAQRAWLLASFVPVAFGCSSACPAGRVPAESGVCVTQTVADFVACVRGASGAELTRDKARQISATVMQVGGGLQWQDRVQAAYSGPNEQNQRLVIDRCIQMTQPAHAAQPSNAVQGSQAAQGAQADQGSQAAQGSQAVPASHPAQPSPASQPGASGLALASLEGKWVAVLGGGERKELTIARNGEFWQEFTGSTFSCKLHGRLWIDQGKYLRRQILDASCADALVGDTASFEVMNAAADLFEIKAGETSEVFRRAGP